MELTNRERLLTVLVGEATGVSARFFKQVDQKYEWLDSREEAERLSNRLCGLLVATLVGEIEETTKKSYTKILEKLPDTPTTSEHPFWFSTMPENSSVQGRAKVMWAIRVAFTHGTGHLNQIHDPKVKPWAEPAFASAQFSGYSVVDNRILIGGGDCYAAMRTTVGILESLKD